MVMATLACKHNNTDMLVVGVDLAGNEYAHPPEHFADAFDFAHSHGLGITVHAGEGCTEAAAANITTAITLLHATRIGHGVAARSSKAVRDLLLDRNVTLEICPSSNVHTGSISSLADHPARAFYDDGISIVPCCDNSLLSQTTTSNEYALLGNHCGFSKAELNKIATDSLKAAFFKPVRNKVGNGE